MKTIRSAKPMHRILTTLPRDFESKPPTVGTTAYEYLHGRRKQESVMDDDDVLMIIHDQNPPEGLLIVFKDGTSVFRAGKVRSGREAEA